jgi:hypothetical protein
MTEFGALDEGLRQPSPDSSTPQSLGLGPSYRLSNFASAPQPPLVAAAMDSRVAFARMTSCASS